MANFTPDVARFIREYPIPINQLAQQYFCSLASSKECEDGIFTALTAWKNSIRWKNGYIKSAENWLKSGDYLILPVDLVKREGRVLPVYRESTPYSPEEVAAAEARWPEIEAELRKPV